MNNTKIISLDETSRFCYKLLSSSDSMDEVLKEIANHLTNDFGNYLSPGKLRFFDEMRINFIELLDQIIYEYSENTNYDISIKGYIISDLYSRLTLNLEAFNNLELYKKNIKFRSLYPDDLAIMRTLNLNEMISFLVGEWDDITNLQKTTIKTLLHLNSNELTATFKDIFQNTHSRYLKSAALLGINYNSEQIFHDIIDSEENSKFFDYVKKFNLNDLAGNSLPENSDELVYVILHVEKIITNITDRFDMLWILRTLSTIPFLEVKQSWSIEINNSLSNIFINLDNDMLIELVNTEDKFIDLINFIDYLPRNIFNRITGKLDELDINFHFKINSIIEKGKIDIATTNSNIFNYICWNSVEKV